MIILCLQISQTLYTEYIEKVPLLKDCSAEFINQIVSLFLWHIISHWCSNNKLVNGLNKLIVSLFLWHGGVDMFNPNRLIEYCATVRVCMCICETHMLCLSTIHRFIYLGKKTFREAPL